MSAYLSREPISVDALIAQAATPECGGTCLFLGTVRNGPAESGVAAIGYTPYDDMAEAEFQRIAADARERRPGARSALRHRLRRVPVVEPRIALVAPAPPPTQASDACRHR